MRSRDRIGLLLVSLLVAGSAAQAAVGLLGLRTQVDRQGTTFVLRLPAKVAYAPSQIGPRLYVLDLADVSTDRPSTTQPVESPQVSSYRLLRFQGADNKPHLAIELTLKADATVKSAEVPEGVQIRVEGASSQDVANPAPQKVASLREVSVAEPEEGNGLEVEIIGDGKLDYRTMVLRNPDRVVVDLPDVLNRIRQPRLDVNAPPLKSVRIAQMTRRPLITRVVLDLEGKVPFQVRPDSNRLVVSLGPLGPRENSQAPATAAKSSPDTVVEPASAGSPMATAPAPVEPSVALASDSAPDKASETEADATEQASENAEEASSAELAAAPADPAAHPEPILIASNSPGGVLPQGELARPSAAPPLALAAHGPEPPAAIVREMPAVPPEPVVIASPVASNDSTVAAQEAEIAPPAQPTSTVPSPQGLARAIPTSELNSAQTQTEPVLVASNEIAAPTPEMTPPALPASSDLATGNPRTSAASLAPAQSFAAQPMRAGEADVRPVALQRTASDEPLPVLMAQQTTPGGPGLRVAPQGTPQGTTQCGGPPFTGEPISVNLKDVDLKDFFRLIHEISGLNVVLDPDVSGTVTIVLDEVPWDQAMDIVLKNNKLEIQCMGNVVRVARTTTLTAEAEAQTAKALAEAKAIEQGQPLDNRIWTLSYAKAADLVPTLKRFLSPRGDLTFDPRTNILIVRDIAQVFPTIDGLIRTLDQKSQQVEIEARIVAASRSFARDIGTQLAASGLSGHIVLGGTGLVGESPIRRGTTPPMFIGTPPTPQPGQAAQFANIAQPLITNFPAVAPTSGTSFTLTTPTFALDAIITAAESRGLGKLLSRPKVITQNNVTAEVQQGVRIPIQTVINNTITVTFVNVTLRMTVTPQITADGTVFLTADVENTSIDPGIARINGIPALDTQQAKTQVLVTNGGTVFFGGVIQTNNTLTENQVPLLGSIPLVGNLFRRKATSSTNNELLFFITPRIVQS